MIIYLFLYIIVILGVVYNKNAKLGIAVWAILLFFSVFRGDAVGTDTEYYLDDTYAYRRTNLDFEINRSASMEVLTNFIYYLIQQGASPRLIIVFFSVTLFVFLLLLAKRAKIDIAFLMMILLLGGGYMSSFNISRQWASIAIVAYATTYIFDSNKKKSLFFFLFVVLAASIHFAAIFSAILYFFRLIKLKRPSNDKIIVPLSITIYVSILIMVLMFNLGMKINDLFMPYASGYWDTYSEVFDVQNTQSFFGKISMLIFGIINIIIMIRMDKNSMAYLLPLFIFCLSIGLLSVNLDATIRRAFLYYGFLSSAITAKFFSIEKKSTVLLLTLFVILRSYLFFANGLTYEYSFCF